MLKLLNIIEIWQSLCDDRAAHDWRQEMAMEQPHSGWWTRFYPRVQHTSGRVQQLLWWPLVYCCLWQTSSLSKRYPVSS